MILTDRDILDRINKGEIVITDFDIAKLGSNSYDLCLGRTIATYKENLLDCKNHNKLNYFDIKDEGSVLVPGELYLGVTKEYTESHNCVPFLDGKSSIGRLGITVHVTAGKGDIGYCGFWTLEITVAKPIIVYPGMPFCQIYYFDCNDNNITPYSKKTDNKYHELSTEPKPVESMMWKNFK